MASPPTAPTLASPGRGSGLGLLLALALFAWHVVHSNFLIDDAFISFRYAANWADGLGLAFNPGEAPIEGYSNFLWVALLSVAHRLGFELESASRLMSIVAATSLLVLVHRSLLRRGATNTTAALGALALAAFPPFATWATGGLETALFALLFFVGLDGLLAAPQEKRTRLPLWVAALALPLIRTDGLAFVAVLAVATGLAGTTQDRRRLRPFLACALLSGAAYIGWRYSHYGLWVANTVRVKTGFSAEVALRGFKTSASYLLLFGSPFLAFLALGLGRKTALGRFGLAAALCFAAFLAYNTLVGGDWMPMFRLLAPASPLFAIALASLLQRCGPRIGAAAGLLAIAVAILPTFDLHLMPKATREGLAFRSFRTGYQTERARWQRGVENLESFARIGKGLAQIAPKDATFTAGAIGAIGYYSGLQILDRNGLVEASVATRKGSAEGRSAGHDKRVPRAFFLDRSPTYFEATLSPGSLRDRDAPAYRQAVRHLGSFVFRDAEEAPLRERCIPEAHPLRAEDGLPEGWTLMLLRSTEDRDRARAIWQGLGL